MSVSVVAPPRNQQSSLLSKPKFYGRRQPQDNPGYVRIERKYLRSDEIKMLYFSTLCGAITRFGTRASGGSDRFVCRGNCAALKLPGERQRRCPVWAAVLKSLARQ